VLVDVLDEPVQLEPDPVALTVRASDSARVGVALTELTRRGIGVAEFALGQPSLDEVFLALTGHPTETDNDATTTEDAA
jgi:ABC-2 type transport system ATP-binding protein